MKNLGNVKGVRSELPTKEFRYVEGCLEQKIRVIQHNADAFQDVGIYEEWHPVIVNGEPVCQD